jgi:hypothetical protein
MSPSDFGEILKPFVFLDRFDHEGAPFNGDDPPTGHTVLWTAVASGTVSVPDELRHGDLAAFAPSSQAVEFEARTDAELLLGSAVPHDYPLVLGSHSVHTTSAALRNAESHILAIRRRLV